MSNHLATFESLDLGPYHSEMYVGAFSGVMAGQGVQFTLKTDQGHAYCALTETQAEKLVTILRRRLDGFQGYGATDDDREERIPVLLR